MREEADAHGQRVLVDVEAGVVVLVDDPRVVVARAEQDEAAGARSANAEKSSPTISGLPGDDGVVAEGTARDAVDGAVVAASLTIAR